MPFSGLWAIILGGSSGFGFATAEKLASEGMNIAALYRETSITEKVLLKKFSKLASDNGVTILPYNINALSGDGRSKFLEKFSTENGISKHTVKLLLHSIARGNLKPLNGAGEQGTNTVSVALTSPAFKKPRRFTFRIMPHLPSSSLEPPSDRTPDESRRADTDRSRSGRYCPS